MITVPVRPFAAAILATALAGCTVFPDRVPPRVMDIPVSAVTETPGPSFGETLRVDTPQATEPFDSSRILTKPSPSEYQMFGNVRWRDTAPVLVRELMIATLRQGGRFDGVVNETSPTASGLTLTSDLYAFHSESYGDQNRVMITLYSQLIDNRSRKTLCTKNFQISVPAADNDIENIVLTFGEAGDRLGGQLRDWVGNCLD